MTGKTDAVPNRLRMILILGALVALTPLTIDTYLPALPDVSEDLSASGSMVQLTLTATLFGLAGGQIVMGALSDAWGRRLPLLLGTALHVLASALVAVAPSVEVLAVLRLLQGVGASASAVIGLAIVRDIYTGRAAAVALSRLMLIMGAFPILAPTLGGVLLNWVSWRGVFLVLAAYGFVMLAIVTAGLPETLPAEERRSARLGATARTFGQLLKDRMFVGLVLVAGLTMGALFSYIAGAAYVYQDQFGMSQQTFGLAFGAGAVWLAVGSQLNPVLLRWFEPVQVMSWAIAAGAVAGLLLAVTAMTGFGGLPAVLAGVWAVMLACSLVQPNAPALALSRYGEAAGTAAALLGSLQFGIGAVAAPLVGLLGNDAAAMGLSMFGAITLAGLALLIVVRPWTLSAADDTDTRTADIADAQSQPAG
nr:multidrug effflux MFS transporter [Streptomyces sp. WAC04770]